MLVDIVLHIIQAHVAYGQNGSIGTRARTIYGLHGKPIFLLRSNPACTFPFQLAYLHMHTMQSVWVSKYPYGVPKVQLLAGNCVAFAFRNME